MVLSDFGEHRIEVFCRVDGNGVETRMAHSVRCKRQSGVGFVESKRQRCWSVNDTRGGSRREGMEDQVFHFGNGQDTWSVAEHAKFIAHLAR